MTDKKINDAVARKLGWWKIENGIGKRPEYKEGDGCADVIPDYCGSIEAAWEIVEKLGDFTLRYSPPKKWIVSKLMAWNHQDDTIIGEADTAPMAICLAFLKLP